MLLFGLITFFTSGFVKIRSKIVVTAKISNWIATLEIKKEEMHAINPPSANQSIKNVGETISPIPMMIENINQYLAIFSPPFENILSK